MQFVVSQTMSQTIAVKKALKLLIVRCEIYRNYIFFDTFAILENLIKN
jgi:hypothetical protein